VKPNTASSSSKQAITIAKWSNKCIENLYITPASLIGYRKAVAYFNPFLGRVKVNELRTYQIDTAIRKLAARPLAPRTIQTTLKVLRIMLQGAMLAGLRSDNPGTHAKCPRIPKTKIDPSTPPELALIIREAGKSRATRLFAVLAGTGCRMGEAIALDSTDIDRVKRTVPITKQLGECGLGPPKSENSVRTIGLPTSVLVAIKDAPRLGPLFLSCRKKHLPRSTIRFTWVSLLKRLGLRFRNPHQLRHSVATALVSAGVPLGDVAVYLGDSVKTIVTTYLHPTGSDSAKTLDKILGSDEAVFQRAA
jgi:integrase